MNRKTKIKFTDFECNLFRNMLLAEKLPTDDVDEACAKIPYDKERFVKVEIWQKENFVFFKVTNTTHKNPFNDKHELISTKSSENGLHGFGVKNISRTVSSYGGTLKSDYKDGNFISIAMVPNNE